nr:ribonuclease H-like domain-containing protein [Tanacetum cinerariifolium]
MTTLAEFMIIVVGIKCHLNAAGIAQAHIKVNTAKTQVVDGIITVMPITTAEEKAQRRLEVKARSTLIMGIPNEHQLNFNSNKDAKQLLEAVEKRFGGNAATKKTQRNILKRQLNSPQLAHEDLEQIHPDDIEKTDLRWQMAMLTMRARSVTTATRGDTLLESAELQEIKIPSTRKSVPIKTPALIALVSCDGLGGFNWSDQAEEGPNYALIAYKSLTSDSKSVEERLEFFKKNEFIYLKDIKVLKVEIQMKEIAITELRRKLKVAQKEKDVI